MLLASRSTARRCGRPGSSGRTALIVIDMLNPYEHEDADKLRTRRCARPGTAAWGSALTSRPADERRRLLHRRADRAARRVRDRGPGNPFYAVLALVCHLLGLAALFLLLRAEFVAAAQVIVYAGAVMVLYVFVVAYVGGEDRPLSPHHGPRDAGDRAAVRGRAAGRDRDRGARLGLSVLDEEGTGFFRPSGRRPRWAGCS
jgi:hypothetical protein